MAIDINVPVPEYVETDQEAAELLRLAMRKVEVDPEDYIGWDTETYGKKIPIKSKPLDWMNDVVTFWSLSFKLDNMYHRWCLRQEHFYFFHPLLENPKANIAGWNLKYDAHIAWNCGVNIWNVRRPVDGLYLAKLHDENRRQHGLKSCAEDWCGLRMTPYKSLFDGIKDATGQKAKEFETSLAELAEMGHKEKVADYASYDAYAHIMTTLQLIEWLQKTPRGMDSNLWEYFLQTEIYFTELLWRMERRGMYVDVKYLSELIPKIQKKIDSIEKEINRVAGKVLNINSPKQLASYMFGGWSGADPDGLMLTPVKMTASQQPSTDEEVMTVLDEAGVHIAQRIVEARHLGKTKSTYMDALLALCKYFDDGRIHPSFNQAGARTGRLSTQTPNSQNFPRPDNDEWGIRRAFTAPPGKKLIVADYEQIEMRIMADLSGDVTMLGAIREGKDLHSFTVAAMDPNIKYEDVVAAKKAEHPNDQQKWLKQQRQDKKGVGFGIIYGAGPPKISTAITISEADWQAKINQMDEKVFSRRVTRMMKKNPLLTEDQAVEMVGRHSVAGDKISEYFQVFPQVKGFMDSTPAMCRHSMVYDEDNNERVWDIIDREGRGYKKQSEQGYFRPYGYVTTISGRRRRLEDIDHQNYFYRSEAERQAVNTRIQGSAADIIAAAMLAIEFNYELNMMGVQIVNQVHDEIVMEVPEENAAAAALIVKQIMEHPFGEEEEALSVPIPVDLKIVDCWADAK